MTGLAEMISSNTALYCALSAVNHIFFTLLCLMSVSVVFRVSLRKNRLLWTLAGLISVAAGVSRPFFLNGSAVLPLLWEAFALLQPFLCVSLLVPARFLLKGFAAALGCNLLDLPKYLILILFFHYDVDHLDMPAAFLVEFLINSLFLLVFALLYTHREQKKNIFEPLLRLDPVFFVLLVLSVSSFITSLVLFGSTLSAGELPSFIFALMNLPLFAATVVYGSAKTIRAKKAEEFFRRELDRQILHYEAMEKVNEDLRLFRHDLQKKLRPLAAFLDENNVDAAKEIVGELGVFTQSEGPRYHTGNYRLDTVLFCEQQAAQADGIRIIFSDDSGFPAEGIAPDDIYTIFPNALDNAIEACRHVNGDREIIVFSKIVGDEVFVTVSNPFSGKLNLKNGILQTTKAEKKLHGYGLRIIKKAAAGYGSDNVDYIVRDGRFILRVSLRYKNSFSEAT